MDQSEAPPDRRWVPFRHPVARDWSFWLAVALTGGVVLLGLLRDDGPFRVVDLLWLLVIVPVTWFVMSFLVGTPVAMVRRFRLGLAEAESSDQRP